MKAAKIAKLNFYYWRGNPKYVAVIIYIMLYCYERITGLVDYAQSLDAQISPWLFPFLPCMGASFLPLFLGFVLMVSDAPFRTRQQGLIMQRTGKRAWLIGQMLYILGVSIGFTLLLFVLSWLYVLPVLEWDDGWGAVLFTASINGIPNSFNVYMRFPYAVLNGTNPIAVTLWCATSMIFICYLLGTIMAACNLWLRKGWGAFLISVLTGISLIPDFRAVNPGPIRYILWVSPLNWMNYSLMGHPEQYLPTHAFGIWGPAVLALSLSLLLVLTIGKCNVETDKE